MFFVTRLGPREKTIILIVMSFREEGIVIKTDTRIAFKEQWVWNRTRLTVLVLAFMLFPSALAWISHRGDGALPLWAVLSVLGIALISAGAYSLVAWKMAKLSNLLSRGQGEVAQALIVKGLVECPGVVLMRDDTLVLAPLVGSRISVDLNGVSSIREVRFFNGRWLRWKRGFWLSVPQEARLGFAVAESVATRWRPKLLSASDDIAVKSHNK